MIIKHTEEMYVTKPAGFDTLHQISWSYDKEFSELHVCQRDAGDDWLIDDANYVSIPKKHMLAMHTYIGNVLRGLD
tara:strand:+ start:744 stop:971 length:228 start_codon:yes stop_codon:yes gene_type:complete